MKDEIIDSERRAKAITPFDKESVEDIKNMKLKIDPKRKIHIIDEEFGKMRFIK